MEEQNETEEKQEQEQDPIERAEKVNTEMKELLDRREAILKREEKLQAIRALGGRSAGAEQEQKPKEDTPEEYAKKVLEGKVKFKR